jgi:uncharacterized protein
MSNGICWQEVASSLWSSGFGRLGSLLSRESCESLRTLYSDSSAFRSRIDMAQYRFGRGEYKYFAHPLPKVVAELRHALYRNLYSTANQWMVSSGLPSDYPDDLDEFLERCRRAGQTRSTPLMLHYTKDDYNCLHQDLYGAVFFPFQVVVCLSRPGEEFEGGELLLVEQRLRAQSMGQVVHLEQGEGCVITTRYRPMEGSRGFYRANVKHGVSPLLRGERFALGIIFHGAT